MGLLLLKNLLIKYQKSSLPLKISAPFIVMFLGFWVVSVAAVGIFFSNKLAQDQQEQAKELANLVERDINQELKSLRQGARFLSIEALMAQGVISQDVNQLQQTVLPLKSILDTDIVKIIGLDQQELFSIQSTGLQTFNLQDQNVNALLVTGSDTNAIIGSSNSGPPFLIGTAPIKNDQGVIGGVTLGTALGDDFLKQINKTIREQIIVVSNDEVVASTFSADPADLGTLDLNDLQGFITIDHQDFLAEPILLKSLGEQQFELVLLISQQSLTQAQEALWFFIAIVTFVGSLITSILGYWIAKRVARPIQDITLIAQQVAGESRFDLRAPANTQDDISVLALSVNQLIEWVGQYTNELEVAAQTLDVRVKHRTKKLSNTLKELKDTQAQLIQSEKMSSLGQMIAGIAHEINNPISFVQGNIDPLKEYFQDLLELIKTYQAEYPEPTTAIIQKQEEIDFDFLLTDLDKLLGSMNLGAERVHEIVQSLRNFSRLDEATVKDVDIHEGLDSTLLILNHRIKHEVTVVKKYGDLPLVRCFPAQLNQVFTNIIVNALDAMFDADYDRKKLKIITRMLNEHQVQIIICDNGPGIPREIRRKIFDPFFTTKPVGKGTGLGLGICFRIIQQHQGKIRVRSKIGKGTEFIITLPIDVLPAEPTMADPTHISPVKVAP
ncbi:integral membrane sensor signal transduction histidine kinase [Leptolyngbya sp. Heron Island J]|uniref:ATP-binding protein n=1 Tax=Leptolyngbya sp. Heron Island J TaxID=1385935 RepID=UPI0003B94B45|nr:ATP-binding protein [Leptolyngbya sp. Heron Island J]ESA32702.1 integral membrane sensor signal transduction histidine kinase [Leptolyngbya sp. Heron Island J]